MIFRGITCSLLYHFPPLFDYEADGRVFLYKLSAINYAKY